MQGKLVSVLRGRVLDVAVDVRLGSPTFGKHVAVELSEDNRRQFWVPRGFAHGFAVLSEIADFCYKCDEFYSPSDEITVRWNDPAIGIEWGVDSPRCRRAMPQRFCSPTYGGCQPMRAVMPILVTGVTGQVGGALVRCWGRQVLSWRPVATNSILRGPAGSLQRSIASVRT